jgi:hypothetical protein
VETEVQYEEGGTDADLPDPTGEVSSLPYPILFYPSIDSL